MGLQAAQATGPTHKTLGVPTLDYTKRLYPSNIGKTMKIASGFILALAAMASTAHAMSEREFFNSVDPNTLINRDVKCDVPFPEDARQYVPGGVKAEVVVLFTYTVEGRFRFARVLQSSGIDQLDNAALHAGLKSQCEPFGDASDPALEGSLIGMPFQFTFDNSRGSDPVEVLPLQN